MKNFVFKNETKIIFGRETENLVGEEITEYSQNILLVHSGGDYITKTGILDRVTNSLKESNIKFTELTGVEANPLLSLVREGIKICRKNKIEFILSIGGGSAVDTGKAIAAGVPYDGDVWDLFSKEAQCERALPTGSIVTIAATGSEASSGTVITNEESNEKFDIIAPSLRPKFAILNPELTYTVPFNQTFSGITDILSHVMERYFTSVKNVDLTDRLSEATMKTVIRNAYILLDDPKNYNARAEVMWAATIAHGDLLGTGRIGDWASHMIGTEISAINNSRHGATLSVILPAWMKYVYKNNLDRFVKFAMRVWDVEYDSESYERMALLGIRRFETFLTDISMPLKLSQLNIHEKDFNEIATKTTRWGAIGDIKKLEEKDIVNILQNAK